MIKNFKIFENTQQKSITEATEDGDLTLVKSLIDVGSDVETKNTIGEPILLIASRNGFLNVVKYLISKGADIESTDEHGYTPLICAAYYGKLDVVKYLIKMGADVNAKNNYKNTALTRSIYMGYIDIAKYLIKMGADIDSINTNFNIEDFWLRKDIQKLLIKQNPLNFSLLKKYGILHTDIKEEHEDLDIGSDLGII